MMVDEYRWCHSSPAWSSRARRAGDGTMSVSLDNLERLRYGRHLALAGFGLHRVFAAWLDPVLGRPPAMGGAPILTVLGLFLLALGVQLELSVRPGRPFYRWLYVHARNGFYFNTLANRALLSVWPPAKNKS